MAASLNGPMKTFKFVFVMAGFGHPHSLLRGGGVLVCKRISTVW